MASFYVVKFKIYITLKNSQPDKDTNLLRILSAC